MKNRLRIATLCTLTALTLLSYQNCAPGFQADTLTNASFSSGSGTAGGGLTSVIPVDTSGDGAGSLRTSSKPVGDLTTAKILTWNLSSDIAHGEAVTGATLTIAVSKLNPADGSNPVFFFTNPTIKTGSKALDLRNLRLVVDGVRNDLSTTFQGLNQTVAANSTVVLSTATLLHQLGGAYSATQTIALNFDLLWPNGVPLNNGGGGGGGGTTPVVIADGASLYKTNCASCHGPLANSTKFNASSAAITLSFKTVPSMRYLATVLSQADVDAIAAALK